jgi:hypothetical protein
MFLVGDYVVWYSQARGPKKGSKAAVRPGEDPCLYIPPSTPNSRLRFNPLRPVAETRYLISVRGLTSGFKYYLPDPGLLRASNLSRHIKG